VEGCQARTRHRQGMCPKETLSLRFFPFSSIASISPPPPPPSLLPSPLPAPLCLWSYIESSRDGLGYQSHALQLCPGRDRLDTASVSSQGPLPRPFDAPTPNSHVFILFADRRPFSRKVSVKECITLFNQLSSFVDLCSDVLNPDTPPAAEPAKPPAESADGSKSAAEESKSESSEDKS
jgi:hypothetical protein